MSRTRDRKALWAMIVVVLAIAVVAALAFVWLGHNGPDVPHATGAGRAACTSCHSPDRLPQSHLKRGDDTCRSCHWAKDTASTSQGAPEAVLLAVE